jgi:nucleoside 2-deoxyribosyltransferase
MKIYLAGPLFNIADKIRNLRLAEELVDLGNEVLLPQIEASKASSYMLSIARYCAQQAAVCEALVADLDGTDVDSGTAVEVGIALGSHPKPTTIGYRTDFRTDVKKEIGLNAMFLLMDNIVEFDVPTIENPAEMDKLYKKLALKIQQAIWYAKSFTK